jgi:transposase-like protein
MTIPQFEKLFPNEDACSAYLVSHRWPDGVRCPRCGLSEKVSAVSTMAFKWQCYSCSPDSGYRFSEITGTIFENTNKDLRDWFRVIHMMMTNKKGVSALQVMRVMGFGSYKTAHYMCHRIRAGLMDEEFQQLIGIVEVDQTYIGGKSKNRDHKDRDGKPGNRRGRKQIVAGAVQRNGNVVARVVANTKIAALHAFVAEAVSARSA